MIGATFFDISGTGMCKKQFHFLKSHVFELIWHKLNINKKQKKTVKSQLSKREGTSWPWVAKTFQLIVRTSIT